MRVTLDTKLGGWAMIFDSVTEMADRAAASMQGGKWSKGNVNYFTRAFEYVGRKSPKGVLSAGELLRQPWPEAVRLVEAVKRRVEAAAPEPESIRRKPRWTDTEGDISVDRVLAGEQDVYRTTSKKFVQGVPSITLLTNLDTYGGMDLESGHLVKMMPKYRTEYVWQWPKEIEDGVHPVLQPWGTGMFWRSVACAAAVDILESAGYTVDVWAWCNGYGVYSQHDKQFTAVKIKTAGQPLNLDALCNATSWWFTTYCLFASFAVAPDKIYSIGSLKNYFGPEIAHLDLGDTFVLPVQNVETVELAAAETGRLIEEVRKYQRGEITSGAGFAADKFILK